LNPGIRAQPLPCEIPDDTLTVMHLHLPECLARVLSSTSLIENLLSRVREVAREVKRWDGGRLVLRRTASIVLDAERRFRKVAGHRALPKLVSALGSFVPVVNLPFAVDRAIMRS
jgi:hypothetical protein